MNKIFLILITIGISLFVSQIILADNKIYLDIPKDTNIINKDYVPNEIIVKFKSNNKSIKSLSLNMTNNLSYNTKGLRIKDTVVNNDVSVFSVNSGENIFTIIQQLKNDPNVDYVQPNFVYKLQKNYPNDPFFPQQWGLNNTGQTIGGYTGISGADIKRIQAMNIRSGDNNYLTTGTIVAVIDDGVHYGHPDLSGQFRDGTNCVSYTGGLLNNCNFGYDFVNMDKIPLSNSSDTHGTHVAGIIGAKNNNSIGIVGVNPGVKIMALRAGSNNSLTTEAVLKSILFAQHNGARIINASWGRGSGNCESADIALYNAIKNFSGLFVTAAGNDGKNHIDDRFSIPADFNTDTTCWSGLDNIVSVAAINNRNELASFSDYGINIDISAPGDEIGSTVYTGQYGYMDGTSMSTPFVVGLLSLARSFRPDLSYTEIKNTILDSAEYIPALSGYIDGGRRLDAYSTLYTLDNYSPTKTTLLTPLSGSDMTSGNIVFNWTESSDVGVGMSGYYLQISSGNDFLNILTGVYIYNTGCDISISTTGEYYRRVYAFDDKYNTGSWSDVFSFSITYTPDITPPSIPMLIIPGEDSSWHRGSIDFSWSSSLDTGVGINGYIYEILSGDMVFLSGTTNFTGITLNIDSGRYTWKVKSYDINNNYSVFSSGISFNIFWDKTPETINLNSLFDCETNVLYTSNIVILTGINTGILVSVDTGIYSINGGIWRTDPSTGYKGDKIQLALTSSINFSTGKSITFTYGDKDKIFNVFTRGKKITPIGIEFNSVVDAELNTVYTSNIVHITGLENGYVFTASISQGFLAKNSTYVSGNITGVENGDTLFISLTSSTNYNTLLNSTLNIGTGSFIYDIRTKSLPPSGGGGGGGGGLGSSIPTCELVDLICVDGEYEEKDGVNCRNGELGEECQIPVIISSTSGNISDLDKRVDVFNSNYSSELNLAYLYAYNMGITTMSNIFDANMEGNLIRSHMAKMLVEWAQNVMGLEVNTEVTCDFDDIDSLQGQDLYNFVIQSCQMGLMGLDDQGNPADSFRPDDVVTRAQFGTVLSRAIWGDYYNGGNSYYEDHLDALNAIEIMNNISDPWMLELRGYVMLMLFRANTQLEIDS